MRKFTSIMLFVCLSAVLFVVAGCQPGTTPNGQNSGLTVPAGSTGNPPLIPHEVEASDGGESCIGCHKTGEMGAPVYPDWHATLTDCRQCHVVQNEKAADFKVNY